MRENCRIDVTPGFEDKTTGQPVIECRHLAMAFLEDPAFTKVVAAGRMPEYFAQRGGLTQYTSRIDNLHLHHPSTRQLVGNRGFGPWLADAAESLDQGQGEAGFLLQTAAHAVALKIRRKAEENPARIEVVFYDPELTNAEVALQIAAAGGRQQFEDLSLDQFFREWSDYFAPGTAAEEMCVVAQSVEGIHLARPEALRYLDVPARSNAFGDAMRRNLPEAMKALGAELVADDVDESRALAILEAKDGRGVPALYIAAQEGHVEVVKAYFEVLRQLGITGERAERLLEGNDPRGAPAVFVAGRCGHSQFLDAYGERLPQLGITGERAKRLLEGKHALGFTAIQIATHFGHSQFVKTHSKVLRVVADASMNQSPTRQ
jgi:hypothetical protein